MVVVVLTLSKPPGSNLTIIWWVYRIAKLRVNHYVSAFATSIKLMSPSLLIQTFDYSIAPFWLVVDFVARAVYLL